MKMLLSKKIGFITSKFGGWHLLYAFFHKWDQNYGSAGVATATKGFFLIFDMLGNW